MLAIEDNRRDKSFIATAPKGHGLAVGNDDGPSSKSTQHSLVAVLTPPSRQVFDQTEVSRFSVMACMNAVLLCVTVYATREQVAGCSSSL